MYTVHKHYVGYVKDSLMKSTFVCTHSTRCFRRGPYPLQLRSLWHVMEPSVGNWRTVSLKGDVFMTHLMTKVHKMSRRISAFSHTPTHPSTNDQHTSAFLSEVNAHKNPVTSTHRKSIVELTEASTIDQTRHREYFETSRLAVNECIYLTLPRSILVPATKPNSPTPEIKAIQHYPIHSFQQVLTNILLAIFNFFSGETNNE